MNVIGIVLLCIFCYCIGLQKGKNPNFFKFDKKQKNKIEKKREGKKPFEKVVSIQQYKEKNKRSGR